MIHFIFADTFLQSRNWYLANLREIPSEGKDNFPLIYVNSSSSVDKNDDFVIHEVGDYKNNPSWVNLPLFYGEELTLTEYDLLTMLEVIFGYRLYLNEQELKSLLIDMGTL